MVSVVSISNGHNKNIAYLHKGKYAWVATSRLVLFHHPHHLRPRRRRPKSITTIARAVARLSRALDVRAVCRTQQMNGEKIMEVPEFIRGPVAKDSR